MRSKSEAQSCDGWQKPLATALKHLNYSPVRWNSQDAPLRRFAALLVPIALLLAVQSQDSRLTASFRQNCQTMLQRLTPAFLVNAGLASDYSSEMLRFLREFDKADHDPAKTLRQKRLFFERQGLQSQPCLVKASVIC